MAPAPKARYQRRPSHSGKPVADGDDGKSSEDTKVGEENTPQNDDSRRPALNPVSDASKGRDRSGSPMTSTLLLRRSSAGVDGRMENVPVPVRASFDDIKQHLKHLGPSNRASNPKVTRSTTVKIKPGVVVHEQPRSHSVAEEVIPEVPRYEEEEPEGDETTSLLKGAITPKDGVHALAQSYGATGTAAFSRSLDNSTPSFPQMKTADTTKQEDQATQTSAHPSTTDLPAAASTVPELRTQKSTSSNSETEQPESNPYGHRNSLFARSGSITEQVVETRGIRKTVLGTTSSNEDEDEQRPKSASRISLALSPVEGRDEEGSGSGQSTTPAAEEGSQGQKEGSNENGNGNSAGKKKNRRKKRKGKS